MVHVIVREPVTSAAPGAPPVGVQPAGENEDVVTAVALVEDHETVKGT